MSPPQNALRANARRAARFRANARHAVPRHAVPRLAGTRLAGPRLALPRFALLFLALALLRAPAPALPAESAPPAADAASAEATAPVADTAPAAPAADTANAAPAAPAEAAPPAPPAAPAAPQPRRVRISVRGTGWWGNIQQTRTINQILDARRGPAVGANEIEDIAFLLISALVDDGYLRPKLDIQVTAPDGAKSSYACDATFDLDLPRDIPVAEIRFTITRGRRYHLKNLSFTGLAILPEADARALFFPATAWAGLSPPYSTAAFKQSISALLGEFRRRGHAQAAIDASGLHLDHANGNVTAEIKITPGPVWEVRRITINESRTGDAPPAAIDTAALQKLAGLPWSQWWQQDLAEQTRQLYFHHGYPDVQLRLEHTAAPPAAVAPAPRRASQSAIPNPQSPIPAIVPVAVTLHVTPGPQVRIGKISLAGNRHTRAATIRRRIHSREGGLFNPVRLENARYRIAQLGVFDDVRLAAAPDGAPVRDITFALKETPRHQASLLAGWGSYEELRGGVELRSNNLIGIADQTRLQLVHSTKSTSGDLNLLLPDPLGYSVNAALRLYGLHREEVSFDREEYGAAITLRRLFGRSKYETSAGYSYEYLLNKNSTIETYTGQDDCSLAASIKLSIGRDRRDNPLLPRRGWHWLLQSETASHALGGDADYEKLRLTASYHTAWKRTRWLHAGLDAGLIEPIDGAAIAALPLNKLHFPGGQNSIRGYPEGKAAPRAPAAAGYLGADVYLLANLELEQALTESWSVVVFYDFLTDKAKLAADPAYECLHSLGLGLRYRTLLGPLRLEYGRNLNPRPADPKGTLHLSIGFPF
ncbi:MAG: BamA/TamA family outer membrane protein [Opitutaceae bacterium]|jgi:outer membrane protein assembly factor BamA|nr:BamA/TamA family outer membrane protein [Opitutaceae bacterium]